MKFGDAVLKFHDLLMKFQHVSQSAVSADVAVSRGQLEKDARHGAEAHRAGEVFIFMAV